MKQNIRNLKNGTKKIIDEDKEKGKGIKRSVEHNEKIIKKKPILKNTKKKEILIQTTENRSNITQSNEEKVDKDSIDVKKREPSKRQLKKEKAEVRALEAKEANKQVIAQKALNYVSQWKHVRNEWKFEKLKQIWLMDNLLNVKYVPDKSFTIILEYFEGCVGSAKKQLVNKAMEVVKKLEDKIKNDEIEETVEYKRAKQLLQTLPIEI